MIDIILCAVESAAGFDVLGCMDPDRQRRSQEPSLMDPTPLSNSQSPNTLIFLKIATSAFVSIYLVLTTSRFRAAFLLSHHLAERNKNGGQVSLAYVTVGPQPGRMLAPWKLISAPHLTCSGAGPRSQDRKVGAVRLYNAAVLGWIWTGRSHCSKAERVIITNTKTNGRGEGRVTWRCDIGSRNV
jgi:hypothetical protein